MEAPDTGWRRATAVLAGLFIAVAVVYGRTDAYPFIPLDDGLYLTGNAVVKQGLSFSGVAWAFTTGHAGNWHPLAWISHMLDVSLFGMDAGAHHLVSAGIHAVNAFLLFLFLRTVTGSFWRSAFAAALFALHPTRVESVAWASERKDLLCAFFWLLGMNAHAAYARRGGASRYVGVVVCHAAALMSKPMAVTFPFALLLLDLWPLRRTTGERGVPWKRLAAEKIPLLALSAAASVATLLTQGRADYISDRSLSDRLGNSALALASYLGKLVAPVNLAVCYPHPADAPGGMPWGLVAGASLLILAVLVVAWRIRERAPFLLVGLLWMAGTLVPVIGIVQVGMQGMADRYTYLPFVGLFIAAAWGVAELIPERIRGNRSLLAVAAGLLLLVLGVLSFRQAGVWRDGVTLFTHAISATKWNAAAYDGLGTAYFEEKRYTEAIAVARQAVSMTPTSGLFRTNLGAGLSMAGDAEGALREFKEAVVCSPNLDLAWSNYANGLYTSNRYAEAARAAERATTLDPISVDAWNLRGAALGLSGDLDGARACFERALALNPSSQHARNNLEKLKTLR